MRRKATSGCKTEEAEEAEIKSEIAGKQGCYASKPAPEGCIGVVVFIPSLGMEVDYGGTLRVAVQNGVGNGLDQSRWVLSGAKTGELQCQAPMGCGDARRDDRGTESAGISRRRSLFSVR